MKDDHVFSLVVTGDWVRLTGKDGHGFIRIKRTSSE